MTRPEPPHDAAPADLPHEAPREAFLTRDRARRFVFRLGELRRERSAFYRAAEIGMSSFADALPTMLALEADLAQSVAGVLARRLYDRERGETEVPFVAAAEAVLERLRRARVLEEARRAGRVGAAWSPPRILALLDDAVRRLDAFSAVYDAERFVAEPVATDVVRLLAGVEEDAAIDRLPSVPTEPPGPRVPPADGSLPRVRTAPDALDDLLRAARAEVRETRGPWRVVAPSRGEPLVLSIGADGPADDTIEASLLGPGEAAARTERAAAVLRFVHGTHGVKVERVRDGAGEVAGVRLTVADPTGHAVAAMVADDAAAPAAVLAPEDEAALRGYADAAAHHADPMAPQRLVAVLGLLRAVDRALDRWLRPAVTSAAATVVARAVPREDSRKAPVRREVLAALAAAAPGLPVGRVSDVLDAVAAGKPAPSTLKGPDAAIVVLVLGRRFGGNRPFGDAVLGGGRWAEGEAEAVARAVLRLSALRADLEAGRDPGAGWSDALVAAAVRVFAAAAHKGAPPAASA